MDVRAVILRSHGESVLPLNQLEGASRRLIYPRSSLPSAKPAKGNYPPPVRRENSVPVDREPRRERGNRKSPPPPPPSPD